MQKPILLYQTSENNISVEVTYIDESFWLTQKAIAELFGVESNTVTYHLKEIFKAQELNEISVTRKIRATASDGKNYNTSFS
jgi:hypothetical protein